MPAELFHNEWERRRLRNTVHLTIGGCLGPCALANVVELVFAGRTVFFQSVDTEEIVIAIYDYIEQLVAAETYLPPPMDAGAEPMNSSPIGLHGMARPKCWP